MGVPKVQALPGELQSGYFREKIISPLTFFSTLETIIGNDNEQRVEYEFLPLEEIEIGMVTEVSTTGDGDDDEVEQQTVGSTEDCGSTETETDSCVQDGQLYTESEEDSEYLSSVLEEIIENSNSYESHDMNYSSLLEDPTPTLDPSELDVNEIISGVDAGDEFIASWLSGLNGDVARIGDSDLDIPEVRESLIGDRIPAKDELRSFILGRRTKTTDSDQVCQYDQRKLRPRTDNADSFLEKYSPVHSIDGDSTGDVQRLRKRQERNRLAAQKCRQKRTKLADELSEESEKLRKENEELTAEVRDLMKELRMLQNTLLDHDLHSIKSQCRERMSANMFNPDLTKITNSLY